MVVVLVPSAEAMLVVAGAVVGVVVVLVAGGVCGCPQAPANNRTATTNYQKMIGCAHQRFPSTEALSEHCHGTLPLTDLRLRSGRDAKAWQ